MIDLDGFFRSFVWSRLRYPVILIVLIGLILRFVLLPLAYDFDIYHWALVIENINSGNNLYSLDGYYYTPIWGYILGFISFLNNTFLNISVMGNTFTDMLPIETLNCRFHVSDIVTPSFNVLIKIPLIICDIVVGYLIYRTITEFTEDRKKAAYGFGLWFLCPIVIYMSSVQAMFDTVSALALLLTVLLLLKDRCFLAGSLFVVAILLKMFPFFCIMVFVGYILSKHRDDGLAKNKLIAAILGSVSALLVFMLPQLINGQLDETVSFILNRTSSTMDFSTIFTMIGAIIAISGMLFFGYRMYKSDGGNADSLLFENVLFALACSLMLSVTPQYVIVMVPFLIFQIIFKDPTYRKCWVLIGVSSMLSALAANNYSIFCILAEYTGLISPEWVLSNMISSERIFEILIDVFSIMQYTGLWLILLFHFSDDISKRWPKIGHVIFRLKYTGANRHES